nr:unnamed protein product [Digitaria exilis]
MVTGRRRFPAKTWSDIDRRFLRPEKDYLSFSLIYKNGQRSLDLVCKDQAEVEVWFSVLEGLISSCRKSSVVDDHKDRVSFSDGSGTDDIESLGDVYVWGEVWIDVAPSDGQTSSSCSKVDVLIPKPLESDVVLDVNQIACGSRHVALTTRQGEVFTWGEEFGGCLGHGTAADISRPKLVESISVTIIDFISCGEFHTCAISASGDLFNWGDGSYHAGLLGYDTGASHCLPKRVSGLLEGLQVLYVACGSWHSALITSSGKLYTFGDGTFGVLGHGSRQSVAYPKEVEALNGFKTVKVACGVWHSAAIVEGTVQTGINVVSKKLYTWGDGDKNRLGHGDKEARLIPTSVQALLEHNFHQLACGQNLTVALATSGHVYTMGSADNGQLGNPKSDDTNSNNANKRNAATRRSTDSREKPERPETRPSRLVAAPSTEPVKYMEVKAAKSDTKAAESIIKASQASALLQFKDLGFAAQFGALQPMGMAPALGISPAIPAFSLAPPSPYTKKTKSPPAAAIPQSSRVDFDNLQKSNELLNQELLKLQSQVDDLKQKCEAQHEQLQKSDKKAKSVASVAAEESTKHNTAVEFVRLLDSELKGIVDKLPSDAVDSIKALQAQMQSLLREQSSHPSELMNTMERDHLHLSSAGSGSESPSHRFMENSAKTQGDFAPKHGTHGEVQLIEQFEPGVYVTLIQLKDGTKVFKRVRFSKRRFVENQAEEWWRENQERVIKFHHVFKHNFSRRLAALDWC